MFTDLHRKPGLPGIYGLDAEGREVSIPDGAGMPQEEWNPDYAALVAANLLPPEPAIDLLAYLKDLRWRREIAGVTVEIGGEPILVSTARGDERATLHATLTAITLGLRADGAAYNFADGRSRAVSNPDMQVAIFAALSHVQAAFDLQLALAAKIEAGTITTLEAIDAAFAAA